jgi:hypothetical protein
VAVSEVEEPEMLTWAPAMGFPSRSSAKPEMVAALRAGVRKRRTAAA